MGSTGTWRRASLLCLKRWARRSRRALPTSAGRTRRLAKRPGQAAGEWTGRADVSPVFARLTGSGPDGCSVEREGLAVRLSAAEARRPLLDAAGRERGVFVVTEAAATRPGDGPEVDADVPLRLDRLDGLVVVTEP